METIDWEARLALEEIFTIIIRPDTIAEPALETPESLKALFCDAVACLPTEICLWLLCMRRQFNKSDKVDRSWQLHSFVMDGHPLPHIYNAIIERYLGLTSTPLTPDHGTSFINDAIVILAPSSQCGNSDNIYRCKSTGNFNLWLRNGDTLSSSSWRSCAQRMRKTLLTTSISLKKLRIFA